MKAVFTNVRKVTTPYFPRGFFYAVPEILLLAGYLIYINHEIWGSLFILVSIIFVTTRYVTEINLVTKTYRDYLLFLGFRLNSEKGKFTQIEKIVITRGDYQETYATTIQSKEVEFSDFTGTLIFNGSHKLDLLTDMNKKRLLRRLKEFAQFLKVGVEDRTTTHPYWIDIEKY